MHHRLIPLSYTRPHYKKTEARPPGRLPSSGNLRPTGTRIQTDDHDDEHQQLDECLDTHIQSPPSLMECSFGRFPSPRNLTQFPINIRMREVTGLCMSEADASMKSWLEPGQLQIHFLDALSGVMLIITDERSYRIYLHICFLIGLQQRH